MFKDVHGRLKIALRSANETRFAFRITFAVMSGACPAPSVVAFCRYVMAGHERGRPTAGAVGGWPIQRRSPQRRGERKLKYGPRPGSTLAMLWCL